MHSTEVARLQSFREAARQIRAASIIDRGLATSVHVWEDKSGQLHVSCDLLDREAFVSLAASLRLVYMNREPGNFLSVCKVIRRHAAEDMLKRVLAIRALYIEGLRATAGAFTLTTGTGTRLVRPREVLEAWMYGEIFHQDADKKKLLQLLRQLPEFQFNLQWTVMLLCGRVLDLDDVVADLLAEPRVPRIGAADKERAIPQQTPLIPALNRSHDPQSEFKPGTP